MAIMPSTLIVVSQNPRSLRFLRATSTPMTVTPMPPAHSSQNGSGLKVYLIGHPVGLVSVAENAGKSGPVGQHDHRGKPNCRTGPPVDPPTLSWPLLLREQDPFGPLLAVPPAPSWRSVGSGIPTTLCRWRWRWPRVPRKGSRRPFLAVPPAQFGRTQWIGIEPWWWQRCRGQVHRASWVGGRRVLYGHHHELCESEPWSTRVKGLLERHQRPPGVGRPTARTNRDARFVSDEKERCPVRCSYGLSSPSLS